MKQNARLLALNILTHVIREHKSLSHEFAKQEPPPLTKELCFGVCRHYIRLQAIARYLVPKQPKSTEVWVCLLMGLYQLYALNIPAYAVVQETVALLSTIKKTWAKGFVNGVLRRYGREASSIQQKLLNNEDYTNNHPTWFIQTMQQSWPYHWQKILAENDRRPPMSLRVNLLQQSREKYLMDLKDRHIYAKELTYAPGGIQLETPCSVNDLPSFSKGAVSVQDEAAQLAALLLDLQPNLRILDACCAPGGKTCQILETQPYLQECVAVDIEKNRLERVKDNLNRLDLKATLIAGDAAKPSTWWDGKLFDRILLDAPCSATGVIRRHPDIKLLRQTTDLEQLSTIQQTLLQALWPLLAPNGLLVYATCSVIPQENTQQIKEFLQTQPSAELIQIQAEWGHDTGYGRQIFPGDHNMDGFFYSILKKIGTKLT